MKTTPDFKKPRPAQRAEMIRKGQEELKNTKAAESAAKAKTEKKK